MRSRKPLTLLLLVLPCCGAHLTKSAAAEFDRYVAGFEPTLVNFTPKDAGDSWIEPVQGGTRALDGALLHHWRAGAFAAGATAKEMLALLRDYKHLPDHYSPRITSSKVLRDAGDTAEILVRLKEQKVITVVLDSEYRIQSKLLDEDRGYSFSRSTDIWQVDSPGTRGERRRTEGDDDGFLWRLNSYWQFARIRDGLLIQCDAISLTRDVPTGLGWLIVPFIRDFPRDTLAFTLDATKKALIKETH